MPKTKIEEIEKLFAVKMPVALHDRFSTHCFLSKITMKSVINSMVEDYLAKHEEETRYAR